MCVCVFLSSSSSFVTVSSIRRFFLCVAERERERERGGGDIGCLFVFVYEEALVYFLLENMIKNYYYLPFFEIHTHRKISFTKKN